ncbi:DUF3237 domain-containing protein [Aurantiacibacter flavus]|uniref:UPF0311 protein ABDJ38_13960 n=1 Tax=Aurantiacibacter flavus TaxID=3145232 RepID=A0ABV0D2J3_9SPHN
MKSFVDVELEHAFDITVFFGADRTIFGPLPGTSTHQGYTPPIGGEISGPMLQGEVVPHSGADYATVRADGTIELRAHYLLKASDGTLIYINNLGYLNKAEEGREERNEQGLAQPAYFRLTPYFRCPEGPHDWLTRTCIVGGGERRADPDHSLFRYYVVK